MNNRGRIIEVNASSLLDLKAELIRKQEEYKQAKAIQAATTFQPRKLEKIVTVKPNSRSQDGTATSSDRELKDREAELELLKALSKSRQSLETKAKLYDNLSKRLPEDEENELYLVDFQRKAIDAIKQKKQEAELNQGHHEPEDNSICEEIPATCPEDEWVDYTDSLGRSRRCLRKDLHRLLAMDKDLGDKMPVVTNFSEVSNPNELVLLSDDMRRELQRKKWEQEAEEALSKPVGPVHYQTVQHEEIRSHGVGYFAFSKDELERKKQLESLTSLRQQTEDQRIRREKTKEKRKQALKARLAKVKQRKKRQLGIEDDEEESKSGSGESDHEQLATEDIPLPPSEPPTPLESATATAKVRPWDVGKVDVRVESKRPQPDTKVPQPKKMMSENDWIQKQRSERVSEFAPPQFYFDRVGTRNKGRSKQWDNERKTDFAEPAYSFSEQQPAQPAYSFYEQPPAQPAYSFSGQPSAGDSAEIGPFPSSAVPQQPSENIRQEVDAMLSFYKSQT